MKLIQNIRHIRLSSHIPHVSFYVAIFAALAGGMSLSGCSDNIENGLYADSESHLSLSVSAEGLSNGLIEIGAAQSSTQFEVTSSTRWTVEITDCEGAWCQVVYGSGKDQQLGDGSFTIEAASNRSDSERECNITVYAIESDGTHIPGRSVLIHFSQHRQSIQVSYAGDVISPFGTQNNEPTISVTANQAWSASASHSWVKIVPGIGMDGDTYTPADGSDTEKTVSFRISVEANPGTSARNAEITISSPTSAFTPRRLNITQEGSSDTFFVSPSTVPTISASGSEIEFSIYSPRDSWTASAISAGDWVTLERSSGQASTEIAVVKAVVAANNAKEAREARIVFKKNGDSTGMTVIISQNGAPAEADVPNPDAQPRVSTAWIAGGWTQDMAQLRAYYNSPYVKITGCGAFLHPANDDSEAATRNYKGTLGENNMLIVDLTDLEPDTEYVAWGYVEYTYEGQEMVSAGDATKFRTLEKSGQPDPGDNNPPSID